MLRYRRQDFEGIYRVENLIKTHGQHTGNIWKSEITSLTMQ